MSGLRTGAVSVLLLFMWGCASGVPQQPGTYTTHYRQEIYQPQRDTEVVERTLWVRSAPKTIVHEVAPLETLWRLSKMYGVSVESIRKANGLRDNTIYVGQKLVIPNARYFKNVIPLYPTNKWRYIILHHTATDIGKATVIHKCHRERGFIYGLGYHFLIDNGTLGKGDGQIEVSPRWIKQQDGAHCKAGGMNHVGIGIALIGDFNDKPPTEAQIRSLLLLLNVLMDYYHIPPSHVMGHGDVPGAQTDCPGKLFPWRTIRLALSSK